MPPTTKESAMIGRLAAMNSILCTIAVITFPVITENGVIPVVIIISKVCRSRSPDMADALALALYNPVVSDWSLEF